MIECFGRDYCVGVADAEPAEEAFRPRIAAECRPEEDQIGA